MRSTMALIAGCALGAAATFAAPQVVPKSPELTPPASAAVTDLEPIAPGESPDSVVKAWYAFRIASAKKTEFSRSLGRVTLESHGTQIMETLELLPTMTVVDSTAILTRFKVGDQVVKEAKWLRMVDGKWLVVGNPVYLMMSRVRQPNNPVTKQYAGHEDEIAALMSKVDKWMSDAAPLWE